MKTTEDEALKKMWTGTFKKHLVGKKITNIRYMTEKEKVDWMWSHCAIVIELDDGQRLIPWADDEGNDAEIETAMVDREATDDQELATLAAIFLHKMLQT